MVVLYQIAERQCIILKQRKKELSLLQKIGIKIRYGMVLQVIKNRIGRLGIEIVPYYFFQGGYRRVLKCRRLKEMFQIITLSFLDKPI